MGIFSTLLGLGGNIIAPGIGGAIGGTIGGLIDSDKAGDAASDAANAANAGAQADIALRRQMYEEGVARQKPFYEAGVNALPGYLQGIGQGGDLVRGFTMGDYEADPGYAFRFEQGQKALERSAAARGGLISGNTGGALQKYGQGMASQEYSNAYNRFRDTQGLRRNALAGVVGFAPTAAGSMATAGQNYASGVGPQMYQQGVNTGNAMIAAQRGRESSYGDIGSTLGKYLGSGNFGGSSGSFKADPGAYAFGTQYYE
jgi:hypothetical protein